MNPEWLKPGTEVVRRKHGGEYGMIEKIGKVHKTGNFTIGTNPQQYKPWINHESGGGTPTGNSYYAMRSCHVVTDAIRAEIAAQQDRREAIAVLRAEIKRLEAIADDRDGDVVAEAAAIRARQSTE